MTSISKTTTKGEVPGGIVSHPGGFLRDWVFGEDASIAGVAEGLQMSRQALSAVVNERAGVSPELALKVEAVYGVRAETLLRMQLDWDIQRVRARAAEITAGLKPAA
jgi:addiction module HigA family antidote